MPVLTGIDVLGVQRYIFASRHLRDVVAASHTVYLATDRKGALNEQDGRVLLAGGSNALLQFDSLDEARVFAAGYTRSLLRDAPGLEIVLVHREYDQGGLAAALDAMQVDLARAKLERVPPAGQLGLGVTARCKITGLPAHGFDVYGEGPLSNMVLGWRGRRAQEMAAARWDEFAPADGDGGRRFPADIDRMGRTFGDTSLLGVVHVDGNDMGRRIRAWLKKCRADGLPDGEVKGQYARWSAAVDSAMRDVLGLLVERVNAHVKEGKLTAGPRSFDLYVQKEDGVTFLPIRPVILGGDDLTFLADGRIALDLAAYGLELLGQQDIPFLGPLTACAGVALVRTHFPFARAYDMASALCASAKATRRARNHEGSWLDWRIGGTRSTEPIGEWRGRAYRVEGGDQPRMLTCRPYPLGADEHEVGSWRWLANAVLGTGECGFGGPHWTESRNKVKGLVKAARGGPETVRQCMTAWQVANPALRLPDGLGDSGYLGQSTPLLDAIELVDIHFPLQPLP